MKRLRARASSDMTRGWNWFFAYLAKRSPFDRVIFGLVLLGFVGISIFVLWQLSSGARLSVLSSGGTLHEGIVGAPRFINPILATTRADQDLSSLLFRGLFTYDSAGALIPDLAASLTVSDDGRTYNIQLKDNLRWHDGVAITADDVLYTIGLVQDPALRSPIRGNWNDVTVEQLGTHELNIILEDPYVPFSENLTLGILPRHLWQGFNADEFPFSQYNTEPIGSGPFALSEIIRTPTGAVSQYKLNRFAGYEPAAVISEVVVHFFPDEPALVNALETGTITHTAALSPEQLSQLGQRFYVYEAPLPRVFALYPNQNRNAALRDASARTALSQAIDREELVAAVLAGYGKATNTPVPVGFADLPEHQATSTMDIATTLLAGGWVQTEDGGWEKNIDGVVTPLAVTITTANTPLFEDTATFVTEAFEAIGVDVSVALYEQTDLVQAVIRPRNYELLLFGTDVGRALDFYPFWHSSQREDPGLNVALYTNITTDTHLETYRTSAEAESQQTALQAFVAELTRETPAIFLFNPTFSYVTTSDTPLELPERLGKPSDRFATIANWHIESESLWPIFITNNH